jgi:2-polyprenyl-3-methyl-5-hydroxy-6-metoxy-1,4-benzoquinol methylase
VCLVCGSPTSPWSVVRGRLHAKCTRCGLIMVPATETEDVAAPYVGDENVFLTDGNENYYLDYSNQVSADAKVEWISQFLPDGSRLLDVGAGFGHFLYAARSRFQACGIDISPEAVRWSQLHFNVNNCVGSIYSIGVSITQPFDAVTAWDILEHLADPVSALQAIRDVLKPEGQLFISTPDAGSLVASLMGKRWHYFDPVQHRTLFSRSNLSQALESKGFTVRSIRTFGHHYKLQYVFDRLAYLNRTGPIGAAVRFGRAVLRPALHRSMHINLRDVMTIAARKI